jgi:hypothetical protein
MALALPKMARALPKIALFDRIYGSQQARFSALASGLWAAGAR